MEMKDHLADITWYQTGNELIALLMESAEIKKFKPRYNRAQRRSIFSWGLFSKTDDKGYIRLSIEQIREGSNPITTFSSKRDSKSQMLRWIDEFSLCQKFTGLYDHAGACFYHGIGECKGACAGVEPVADYNHRVNLLLSKFEYEYNSFFILENGRFKDEVSLVEIENGKYLGFGFAPAEHIGNTDLMHDAIKTYPDNRDVHSLIKQYMRKKPVQIYNEATIS